jgi:hypothetical protein
VETHNVDMLKGVAATAVTVIAILAALKFGAKLGPIKQVRDYVLG